MELTIRDWMVIIGVLLIVVVGLDAWRRVLKERRAAVKIKLAASKTPTGSERDAELAWLRELPNGGARVVKRADLIRATANSAANIARQDIAASGNAEPARQASPPAPGEAPPATPSQERATKSADPVRPVATPAPVASTEPVELDHDDAAVVEHVLAGVNSLDPHGEEPSTLDWLEGVGAQDSAADSAPAAGKMPRSVEPEVFMLNVVARNSDGFRGEDILHILLACDLRFGDMNFFHRHEFEAGRGAIQFSVANMMQPGIFDIDNMGDFDTPGLVFFLTLPGPEDMMKAFEYMLETARAVARNLEGDVLDESRSVLTNQTLEHCRQQIRDLQRRLLARAR